VPCVSQADFEAARPALDGMGGYVVRMGQPGAGAAAKLINQLLTASNALAATEALALARAMGFDSAARLAPLLALLERSWGGSTLTPTTGPNPDPDPNLDPQPNPHLN
jgi:3-hydroxyisobutyrate dehydrogenase